MKVRNLIQLGLITLTLPMAAPTRAPAASDMEYLGFIETLNAFNFTPDDIAFSPKHGGRLFVTASADSGVGVAGVFELTEGGVLVQALPLPPDPTGLLGFSIARVTDGPLNGHFFLADFNGTPNINIFEVDENFQQVRVLPLTAAASPGDAIAYNSRANTLAVVDRGVSGYMLEVSLDGDPIAVVAAPNPPGLAFDHARGTFLGAGGSGMIEFSTSGELLNTWDLSPFGVSGAVGIAVGNGNRIFIADEGDPPNGIGLVHILRISGRR
jgi:hypothetical protein